MLGVQLCMDSVLKEKKGGGGSEDLLMSHLTGVKLGSVLNHTVSYK